MTAPVAHAPHSLSPVSNALLAVIRHTPLSRGLSRRLLLGAFRKRWRHPVITKVRGVPFILHLDNTTEAKALFGQYNLKELAFMQKAAAHPEAVLVDLGANSGFYTQNFLAGGAGRLALAIEPNAAMCQRLRANYELLQTAQPQQTGRLLIAEVGVGDSNGEAFLETSAGAGVAHVVTAATAHTPRIAMTKLYDLLQQHGLTRIDVLKADIEGYEDKALVPFLTEAPPSLFPQHIIIEHTSETSWRTDLLGLLTAKGYVTAGKTRGNLLLSRKA